MDKPVLNRSEPSEHSLWGRRSPRVYVSWLSFGALFVLTGCPAEPPVCGDGILSVGEVCEGSQTGASTCESEGFSGGTLGCNDTCQFLVTDQCTGTGPECGNGVVEGGEVCDGEQIASATCVSAGFDSGTISCNADCALDTSLCENTSACTDDDHEENDAFDSPLDITLPFSAPGGQICASDEDYYRFSALAGAEVVIDLAFAHATADLDILLFDASGNQLAVSQTDTDDEHITYAVPNDGDYTLRVYAYTAEEENAYSLTITATVPPACTDAYEENGALGTAEALIMPASFGARICPSDEDFYQVVVISEGDTLNIALTFTHADGDVDMELLGAAGERLALSETENDDESITYVVPTGSALTHYIRVYGSPNDYAIMVTLSPPTGPVCGDGMIEGTEVCDSDDISGRTCGDEGLGSGTLACHPMGTPMACTYDTAACCMDDAAVGNDTRATPAAYADGMYISDDDDWYDLTGAVMDGETFEISMFHEYGADLNLELYSCSFASTDPSACTILSQVSNSGGPEIVRHANVDQYSPTYRLRVHRVSGECVPYSLHKQVLHPSGSYALFCSDDSLEDNDTFATAATLPDAGYNTIGSWRLTQTPSFGTTGISSDEDFYNFTVNAGTSVTVRANFHHGVKLLNLEVWRLGSLFHGCSDPSGACVSSSSDDNEVLHIDNTGTEPLALTARVHGYGDCTPYDFVITRRDDALEPNESLFQAPTIVSETGLVVTQFSPDYFAFDSPAGAQTRLHVDATNSSLEVLVTVYDEWGVEAIPGPGTRATGFPGRNWIWNADVSTEAHRYFVRVVAVSGQYGATPYNLSITQH